MASETTSSRGRMHALDGLRGTMMLLGLVLHSACSYMKVGLGDVWPYQDHANTILADLTVSFIHVFRMPIFFGSRDFLPRCFIRGVAPAASSTIGCGASAFPWPWALSC